MRLDRKGAPETSKLPAWERENWGCAARGPLQSGGLEDVEALWGPPSKGPAVGRVHHCGLEGGGQESGGDPDKCARAG